MMRNLSRFLRLKNHESVAQKLPPKTGRRSASLPGCFLHRPCRFVAPGDPKASLRNLLISPNVGKMSCGQLPAEPGRGVSHLITIWSNRAEHMKRTIEITIIALALCLSTAAYSEDKASANASMTLHHMHIMINHAVEMAAEGSNLIMIGEMDMAKGVDALSISHGRQMLKHAKSPLEEVMKGDAMARLHKEGKTPEASKEMAYTHNLAKAAMTYIDMLARMPQEVGHKH